MIKYNRNLVYYKSDCSKYNSNYIYYNSRVLCDVYNSIFILSQEKQEELRRKQEEERKRLRIVGHILTCYVRLVHYRLREEEAMRIERELLEAEEIARKEAEAEAAALTEILNLENVLQVCQP